ncbi:MAG: class I SAM-dependent methyltransferase [Sedimentisphaerales bacterium]|nr:class I SAM-dependent methyltransferase [Sedimentisphaerales bacterium]
MRITIDTDARVLVQEHEGHEDRVDLYSTRAFEILSQAWLKVGWNERYAYAFSWMGRPVIQNPEDLIRVQEVVYRIRPDVIIETGVAHGGSLVFYASLCKAMGKGRVVGVDIEIRPQNREALEDHELSALITLIEGSSTDSRVVKQVRSLVGSSETTLIFLDSNHTKQHVLTELEAYHGLVTPGSYIVATDGIMRDLHDVPRGRADWASDNPAAAAVEFTRGHPDFVIEQPPWPFNESKLSENVTYWPDAWLRRQR